MKELNKFTFRKDSGKYRNDCKECKKLNSQKYYNSHKKEMKKKAKDRYMAKRSIFINKRKNITIQKLLSLSNQIYKKCSA